MRFSSLALGRGSIRGCLCTLAMALLDSLGRCSPACVVSSQTRAHQFSAASLRWALGDPSVFSRSFFFFGTLSLCYPSHLDLIIFSSSLYHFLLHIFLRPGISGTQRESKGEAGPTCRLWSSFWDLAASLTAEPSPFRQEYNPSWKGCFACNSVSFPSRIFSLNRPDYHRTPPPLEMRMARTSFAWCLGVGAGMHRHWTILFSWEPRYL